MGVKKQAVRCTSLFDKISYCYEWQSKSKVSGNQSSSDSAAVYALASSSVKEKSSRSLRTISSSDI